MIVVHTEQRRTSVVEQPRDAGDLDVSRPNPGRIYDWFLGGNANWAIDRVFGERLLGMWPEIAGVARQNRSFLRRAVVDAFDSGIRQFLDLGSGIPTIGHVHEVARRRTRHFRVVYVDNEPLTVAHSKPLLAEDARAAIIEADCRDPQSILGSPEAAELLDFDEPIGLLMSAVVHFLPDRDTPGDVVECYRKAVAPGSYLAISHVTGDYDPGAASTLQSFYAETTDPLVGRSTRWIDGLFGDFEVLPPGASYLTDWRPDPDQATSKPRYRILYGGMARKQP